jgi:triosephosphate isomerase
VFIGRDAPRLASHDPSTHPPIRPTHRIFGDSDELVNTKVHKVLAAGLKPILCIGETKDEYELGINKLVGRASRARIVTTTTDPAD